MADSTETRALLLQINATTELLRSQLTEAERATAEFQHSTEGHLSSVDDKFDALGKSVEKLEGPLEKLKGYGETALGFLLGESLVETGKKALEFGGNIQFVSEQVGTSTDFLQKYRYAASQFGVAAGEADEGLGKFARSIGEVAAGDPALAKTFDKLHVDIFSIVDGVKQVRSVEDVFKDTVAGIKKFDTPAEATADTMQLMGKSALGLVPLMQAGADGFNQLADAAEQLGVVLSPELIEHSEDVNHKLAALKLVLDAQMANAVAQNAESIETLATGMVKLAGGIAKFLSSNPEHALEVLGGLAGLQIGSKFGPWGAAIGATVGFTAGGLYGQHLDQQHTDMSTNLQTRRQQLLDARAQFDRDRALRQKTDGLLPGAAGYNRDHDEYLYQAELFRRALKPSTTNEEGGVAASDAPGVTNIGNEPLRQAEQELAELEKQKVGASGAVLKAYNDEITQKKREIGFIKQGADAQMASALAGKQGSAEHKAETAAAAASRKAEQEHLKQLQEDRSFQAQLRAAQEAYARAEEQLADTAKGQLDVTVKSLRDALKAQDDQVDDQVDAGRMTAARGEQLKSIYQQTETDNEILAMRKYLARIYQEAADKAELELQGKIDLATLQDRLSTTRKQRLAVELKLLELQETLAKQQQFDIIANPNSTPQQRAQARTRIAQIDQQHPLNVKAIEQQNASPLDQFKLKLHQDTDDMTDALQSVEVDGLQSLSEGLIGIIDGTESVASAFKKMATSIVDDIARIVIEKAILSAIGGGSLFGIHFADGGEVEAHAAGGLLSGPGSGTSDSIIARVSNGEFIINAESTRRWLPVLEAINNGHMPGFADGGLVSQPTIHYPKMPSLSALSPNAGKLQLDAKVQVDASPLLDARMQDISVRTVGAAAEPIMAGAQTRTITRLNRPRLPGGWG